MNDSALTDYRLSSNGKVIVTMDTDGRRVKSWDVASQRQLAVVELKAALNNSGVETPLALSPDGEFLAFSYSENVMLWGTSSTQEPIYLGKCEKKVSVLAFSADGKLVAVGDETGAVKVFAADTRKELSTFTAHKDGVMALAFSPDGKTLASGGGDGTVKIYGIASMRELIALTHTPSPVIFFGVNKGTEDYIEELFFSADGRSLITLSENHILRIWRGARDADLPTTAR